MGGPLPSVDAVSAAIRGVENAQRTYEGWSGEWLWQAPEYMTTVYVAKALAEAIGPKFVTLETNTKSALEDAGAKGRGRLHWHIRQDGRFDILLWWANGTPRAPIEVKVQVTNANRILADVRRIEKVVLRKRSNSTIDFGLIVYYISLKDAESGLPSAKQKIEKRIKDIFDDVFIELNGKCRLAQETSKIHIDQDSAWAAVVLIIKPPREVQALSDE